MKKWGKRLGYLLGFVVVAALLFYGWAAWKVSQIQEAIYRIDEHELAVPFPLDEAELEALREERRAALAEAAAEAEAEADPDQDPDPDPDPEVEADPAPEPEPEPDLLAGLDLDAIALERAVARGEHLANAIYVCVECHGADLSGGVMLESGAMGTFLGPNLTSGRGSAVADYEPVDWERAVRHGVGTASQALVMPSVDFDRMSDRELSDLIAYIRSVPPVDNEVPEVSLGPLGTVLVATGALPLSADLIDHDYEHPLRPPEEAPTAEYGEHLMAVCTGCHRDELVGGPIEGGDPDWLPAANLTTLEGWSYEDFVTAMRELKRPDGTDLRAPMSLLKPYAERMTEVELGAMWAYLETLEPRATGE